jgi:transposase
MVDLKSGLEIEVLSAADAARRRQWSEADKLRIVEASFAGRRLVSATARRHGVSRSLLTTWRRQFREGTLGADRQPSFARVVMAPEVSSRAEPVSTRTGSRSFSATAGD